MGEYLTWEDAEGKKAKDTITGFVGIVTGFSTRTHGGACFELSPKVGSDLKLQGAAWFPTSRIELVEG